MENLLQNITKEELIAVIGNMHDTIQEWHKYGLDTSEENVLNIVGNACRDHLSANDLWRDSLTTLANKIK